MYKANGKVFGCPIEAVSHFLGKKWVAQIIWNMKDEKKHFSDLKRALKGCSTKMLIQQLRLLEELGVVCNEKITFENNEVSSTYMLTKKGISLLPVLEQIINWGNINLENKKESL